MKLRAIEEKTPLGIFSILFISERSDEFIALVSGFANTRSLRKKLPSLYRSLELEAHEEGHPLRDAIKSYFNGDHRAFSNVPLQIEGTRFQEEIWNEIAKIKLGETISYRELAGRSGHASAIRAAASACALNRLVLLLPCHRIIRSDGSIGDYAFGKKRKEALLRLERE